MGNDTANMAHVCEQPNNALKARSLVAGSRMWLQLPVTKNKTILLRQPHVRLATVGWNRHCKHTVADTKNDDLYVGAQPMTAGCNRRCRLSFYQSGKGASVG